MKKMINDPQSITDELVEGFVLAHSDKFRKLDGMNVVVRKDIHKKNKTSIVIGGGSGHEPLFLEFIGEGMADAIAHGAIFTSPASDIIRSAITSADTGKGVILIYGNYMGDILNFDIAQDEAREKGIRVETVRVWDDIASAPPDEKDQRRGTAGDLFVIKTAGAAAEQGYEFEEVLRIAKKARDNCRTLGVALSSCTNPAVGVPLFALEEDEMVLGMGLHGEMGFEKMKLQSADEIAGIILNRIFDDDLVFGDGDQVALLVNGYGSTTMMELYIINRKIHQLLSDKNICVEENVVGNLCTSQEMSGCSITLMKLDNELKQLLAYPANSPGFTRIS